jgi:hypothetical protein
MTPKVLVLHPPNANQGSTLASLHHHQNQPRGLLQAPTLEAVGLQQLGIEVDDERGPGLAS